MNLRALEKGYEIESSFLHEKPIKISIDEAENLVETLAHSLEWHYDHGRKSPYPRTPKPTPRTWRFRLADIVKAVETAIRP